MLLEAAIGDAYGIGFEYQPAEYVRKYNLLQAYRPHGRYPSLNKKYSDDTQMSMAIAELMLEAKTWTPQLIADKFVTVFKRDVRKGYASGFYDFLMSIEDGTEFLAKIKPHSNKNGAAMRAWPIGLYSSIDEVHQKAQLQARLTHDTPIGVASAQAAALMIHYFAHIKAKKSQLGQWLERELPGNWNEPWTGPVGEQGDMAVRAAITAIQQSDNMQTLLQKCVAYTHSHHFGYYKDTSTHKDEIIFFGCRPSGSQGFGHASVATRLQAQPLRGSQ